MSIQPCFAALLAPSHEPVSPWRGGGTCSLQVARAGWASVHVALYTQRFDSSLSSPVFLEGVCEIGCSYVAWPKRAFCERQPAMRAAVAVVPRGRDGGRLGQIESRAEPPPACGLDDPV